MKKISFLMSCAAMLALSFTSCEFNEDNGVPLTEDNGVYDAGAFKTALVQGATVELGYGAVIELDEQIELPADVKITSDKKNPATIIFGEAGGFLVSANASLQNVKIDAAALKNPVVQLAEAVLAEGQTAVEIKNIIIDNVEISGLASSLIKSVAKGTLVKDFTVNNSVVTVAGDVTVFDFTKGSVVSVLNVTNSTFFAPTATTKSMYSSQGGQKATEFGETETQTFNFQNSTICGFATNKNFFSHRQSNQKWLVYTVKNNIFVDCGKKGQTVRGMNGGQNGKNPTWTIDGNAFQFFVDGVITDSSADESTNDSDEPVQNNFEGVVEFADYENGDFLQNSTKAGDSRWLK